MLLESKLLIRPNLSASLANSLSTGKNTRKTMGNIINYA